MTKELFHATSLAFRKQSVVAAWKKAALDSRQSGNLNGGEKLFYLFRGEGADSVVSDHLIDRALAFLESEVNKEIESL